MKKRLLSVLLILCMALTLLPVGVLAAPSDSTEATVDVTVDDNATLWGDAVKVAKEEGKIKIAVDLTKLNEKASGFEQYLKSNNGYFRFNTGNEITTGTNGAQLTLPIKIMLTNEGVTPTAVTCVRMSGETNMDGDGTSKSATYSKDFTTVNEWPVVAFAPLTYNSDDGSVSWANTTAPFAFNDKGATGNLNTWTYRVTWTASESTYTKDIVIELTKTPADPEIVAVGYNDDAAKAHTALSEDMTAAGCSGKVEANGIDKQTMWVTVKGLLIEESANYKVVVTHNGAQLTLKDDIDGDKTGPGTAFSTTSGSKAVYWTFNPEATGGSVINGAIDFGTYTFELQRKDAEGNWAAVGEAKELEIAKVSFVGEIDGIVASKANNSFVDVSTKDEIKFPAAPSLGNSLSENIYFTGWKVDDNPKLYQPGAAVPAELLTVGEHVCKGSYSTVKIITSSTDLVTTTGDRDSVVPGTDVTAKSPKLNSLDKNDSNAIENGKIIISGSIPAVNKDNGSKYYLAYKCFSEDTDQDNYQELTITSSDGSLTVAPSSFVKGLFTYDIDYSNLRELVPNVEIGDTGVPSADVAEDATISFGENTSLTNEVLKETVEKTVVEFHGSTIPEELSEKANVITSENVTDYLSGANEGLGEDVAKYTTIEVVPYLDIEIGGFNETENSLTLNITPMIKYQAVKDDGTTKADIEMSPIPVRNAENVRATITFEVPTGFTDDNGKLYVSHKGNIYVANKITNSNTYSFTTNGFSPFVITAENPAAVSIGYNNYETLQGAIDAIVSNAVYGNEITLLKDNAEKVTMTTEEKQIIVNTNGKAITGLTVNGTAPTPDGEGKFTISYTKPSTPTHGGNWGSISTGNAITAPASTPNGKVSISSATAKQGDTVTVTVTPDSGYVLDTLTVTDAAGKAVTVTRTADGKYTFTMPATAVKVDASFKKAALPFTDVANGAWYYDAVAYVHGKGLMNGTADTLFSPDMTTTRGMVVTLLYRLEGQPAAPAPGFTDVPDGQWYSKAIAWATVNKIVNGYGDGTFGPNDTMTREQLAAVLYRYAGYKGYDVSAKAGLAEFKDAASVSAYARDAMSWAVAKGLVNGVSADSLAPQGSASRAQLATILMRFCETVAK